MLKIIAVSDNMVQWECGDESGMHWGDAAEFINSLIKKYQTLCEKNSTNSTP